VDTWMSSVKPVYKLSLQHIQLRTVVYPIYPHQSNIIQNFPPPDQANLEAC